MVELRLKSTIWLIILPQLVVKMKKNNTQPYFAAYCYSVQECDASKAA